MKLSKYFGYFAKGLLLGTIVLAIGTEIAYHSRGYAAIGGEWCLAIAVFGFTYAILYFNDKRREREKEEKDEVCRK